MQKPRFLTKSRFKTAYECPRKLYYLDRSEYGNNNKENEFLEALAQGGYQVGALAKVYHPNGIDLEGLDSEPAITRTNELLKSENVVIFEAALNVGPYLVRVDVLEKIGNTVRIFEVKAKSYLNGEDSFFTKNKKGIVSEWEPYLIDVAFQTWVARQLLPNARIKPYLMLANKAATTSVDRLHQNFLITNKNGRSHVEIRRGTTRETVGAELLIKIDTDEEVRYLIEQHLFPGSLRLPQYAANLAEQMSNDGKPSYPVGSFCKNCEFRISRELKAKGKKSGFDQCWIENGKLNEATLNAPLVFDLWNYRNSGAMLENGVVFLNQLKKEDLLPKNPPKEKSSGLSMAERQWIQVEKTADMNAKPYFDAEGIASLFSKLKYPFHFIDFETTMVAIPFHRNRRPYEQIAFQFSHHTLDQSGKVEHMDQYIHFVPNEFPNFEFVRRLRASLMNDDGTIFRYSNHENTVLRQILTQIQALPANQALPDAKELSDFILSITKATGKNPPPPGARNMVDLLKIITDFYYHPAMGGSNSIKKVIPAILADSEFLQRKYPEWIKKDSHGKVTDPYKNLPPVFQDIPQELFEGESPLFSDESIDDGGAAMTAWARMQFTEMKDTERKAITAALLNYCKLDTLSMVWIVQHFQNEGKFT